MSVLVKGMKMPKACCECGFNHCSQSRDDDTCLLLDKGISQLFVLVDRLPDCPLVEIPTPHGRLIDGIDLLTAITENAYIIHHGHNEVEYGMSSFGIMQAISEAPTIIEAEEGEKGVCE